MTDLSSNHEFTAVSGMPGERTFHYYSKDPKTGKVEYEVADEKTLLKTSRWLGTGINGLAGGVGGAIGGMVAGMFKTKLFPNKGKGALIGAGVGIVLGAIYGFFKSKSALNEVMEEEPNLDKMRAMGFTPPAIPAEMHPGAGKSEDRFRKMVTDQQIPGRQSGR